MLISSAAQAAPSGPSLIRGSVLILALRLFSLTDGMTRLDLARARSRRSLAPLRGKHDGRRLWHRPRFGGRHRTSPGTVNARPFIENQVLAALGIILIVAILVATDIGSRHRSPKANASSYGRRSYRIIARIPATRPSTAPSRPVHTVFSLRKRQVVWTL
jgi:hypothetical protein